MNTECSLYLTHMRDVICAGDEEKYARLLDWMRNALTRPGESGVALVIQGPAGGGMSIFLRHFGNLFTGGAYLNTQARHLCGVFFTSSVQDCQLLNIDVYGRMDKHEEAVVKELLTEHNILIDKKGEEAKIVPNKMNIVLSTNGKFVVPETMDDRRFFILDVADTHVGDREYFVAIAKQMNLRGTLTTLRRMLLTNTPEEL